MFESLAAGVVGATLLWLVLQPILSPHAALPVDTDPPDPEETPRGQALLALKEIEFDRATGKLSDSDYTALSTRYSAAAIATLEPEAGNLHCRVHGPRNGTRYCNECGAGLLTDAGACAACGFAASPDAKFCPGCGVPVLK